MERNVPGGRELRRGAQGRACGTSWGTGDEVAEMSWGVPGGETRPPSQARRSSQAHVEHSRKCYWAKKYLIQIFDTDVLGPGCNDMRNK